MSDPEVQVGLLHRDDFWNHPSIEKWWDPEVKAAESAIDQKKAVILSGPHGIGKSKSFATQLVGDLSTKGYVTEAAIVWDQFRKGPNRVDPWQYFKQNVLDGDGESRKRWIEVHLNTVERRRNPDAHMAFILDEIGFEQENLVKAREFFVEQGIVPVFIHPMGYQEEREKIAQWGEEQEGFETIIVDEKLLPQEALTALLKATKADDSLLDLVDDPEARLMLHPRFFNDLLGKIMPVSPGEKPMRTIDDLKQWLEEEVRNPLAHVEPRLFTVDDNTYTLTNGDYLFFAKYLKGEDIRNFLSRIGFAKTIKDDVIVNLVRQGTSYGEELDPLAFD